MAESVRTTWETCRHQQAQFLGEDRGRNRYLECPLCRAVLVTDGIHVWVVPPGDAPASP